jgi:hypothetical protein
VEVQSYKPNKWFIKFHVLFSSFVIITRAFRSYNDPIVNLGITSEFKVTECIQLPTLTAWSMLRTGGQAKAQLWIGQSGCSNET